MRIAHITATFPPYYAGTGMVCYYNARYLSQLDHDVIVYTAGSQQSTIDSMDGFCVRRLPAKFRFGNAPFIPDLLSIRDFDLIHLHHPFIFGAEFIRFVCSKRNIPLVVTHHNDLIGKGVRKYLFQVYQTVIDRSLFRSAKRIIVVTKDHAEHSMLSPIFKKRWDVVREIPNGVDTALFCDIGSSRSVREQYQIPDNGILLLFVGALDRAHHYRRVDLLIRAASMIQVPDVHLLIVGGGDGLQEYQRICQVLGISGKVHFAGSHPHSDLPKFYQAADIVVLPSQLQESFGMVLIEAMSCGKPVISSNLPGVRTIVSNGVDGLLTAPGELPDLVKNIQFLASDSDLRMRMGQMGRRKVVNQYDWKIVVSRLDEVYREIVS